ncbi:hypothetical protein PHMEG_00031483 [Phytophthora megakarya]|uniref:Uncharacterized protein n=1 Tax=Phytophthora megakarya TaxID=4795 RepID=A0A225UYI3_9STRA|nr:hypothetical protein PHMEG_00031483 [Phytophthora megakarya]
MTGLTQPMNSHLDHDFARNASERRLLLSTIIGKTWNMVNSSTIVNGFRKTNHIPKGPRDSNGRFRTHLLPPPEDAIVPEKIHKYIFVYFYYMKR